MEHINFQFIKNYLLGVGVNVIDYNLFIKWVAAQESKLVIFFWLEFRACRLTSQ